MDTPDRAADAGRFAALTVPVHHASTLTFATTRAFLDRRTQLFDGYSYGLYGTPTTRALEDMVARIEGGSRSIAVPSGLAAVTGPLLALLRAGDRVLVADCVYGSTRDFCTEILQGMGISVAFFPSDADSIAGLLTPATRLVLLETPGYYTMELQDIDAIAREAHAVGALVMADNSYGFGLSNLFTHGVDIVATALSKYGSGHSDLCMGSITVADDALFRRIKLGISRLGIGISADDAYLVIRSLQTLPVRLAEHARRTAPVVDWLARRPEIDVVLYPHSVGPQRDRHARFFRGGHGLLAVRLRQGSLARLSAMLDAMQVFRIGASWGGVHSLIAPFDLSTARRTASVARSGWLLRLHVGLEPLDSLLADLDAGFARFNASS